MRKEITSDMALRAIGNNFDLFEIWYMIFMNPGTKIPLGINPREFIQLSPKGKKPTSEEAYFSASLVAISKEYSDENNREITLSQDALSSVYTFASYYSTMQSLVSKDIGFVLSQKKDEYGLPVFIADERKLLETEQELIKMYGKNWREVIMNQ